MMKFTDDRTCLLDKTFLHIVTFMVEYVILSSLYTCKLVTCML